MNRQELIEQISDATGDTKAATGRFLDAFISTVEKSVASGDKVSLVGFGSFEAVERKARQGRNPATGGLLTIDATVRPKFTPGNNFKSLVKKSHEA